MKPKLLRVLAVIALAIVSGCVSVSRPAPTPPDRCWSDREQIDERTRFYPNVDEEQALAAGERLLRLAGRDDMKIVRSPHSLAGELHRQRVFYLFLVAHSASVWDHWTVATRPETGGVRICVQVHGQTYTDTFVLGAEPVTHAIYPASAIERDPGKRFKPPAHPYAVDYDSFWGRLDYLLGVSPAWTHCPAGGLVRNNPLRGRKEVNPLCHSLIDDASPQDADRP